MRRSILSTSDLDFREAVAGDIPAIVAMLADDPLGRLRENPALPLDERYYKAFEAINSTPLEKLIVAELAGEIIGTMQISFLPGLSRMGMMRAQVEAVRVRLGYRDRGFGTAMIDHAIELAREAGCGVVQLTTDKSRREAHIFYEKLGFEASHLGYKKDL